jgi:EmrB/QacA subfamily drug resistance transporter
MGYIKSRLMQIDYKWKVFLVVSIGLFTSVFDFHSVVVALPSIATEFDTDLPTVQWVVIGYGLTVAALLLPMGRLADIVGRKEIYVIGFIIFTLGGALAAFSTGVNYLIISKLFQGLGSAMTQGVSMAMVIAAFGSNDRGKALGLTMSVVGAGGIVGPAISGFLVGYAGWQSVFFTTAALGAITVLVSILFLKNNMQSNNGTTTFDWMGAIFSTITLVSFLSAMTMGSRAGWGYPLVSVSFLICTLSLVVFVWWETRTDIPLLDVRLFKQGLFGFGVAASFLAFMSTQSIRFLIPFYLQLVLGYSPQMVGWTVLPASFCLVIMGPLSGKLSDKYGWKMFNIGGLVISGIGLLILSRININSQAWLIITAMTIQSMGVGMFNAPNNSAILSVVDPTKYGVVSGFLNLIRNSANVTGIAIATAVVTATMGIMGYPPSLSALDDSNNAGILEAFVQGLKITYLVGAGFVFCGSIMSIFGAKNEKDIHLP